MIWIVRNLWLIPAMPALAAGLSALAKRRNRGLASSLAIGSMALSFLLSLYAFVYALSMSGQGELTRHVFNFPWLRFGSEWLKLGWMLDPLTAVMLVMVTFVGLLIFIYSTSYMSHDENFTRFFCFLSLFAAAMLGVVIANSLLLLFMCWELVGLTSYLLIGYDRCGYGHWDSVYGRNAPTLGGGVPLIQGNEVPQHPRPSQMGDSGPETHAHLVCIHATQ